MLKKEKTIGLIGAGNIGEAIIKGLIESKRFTAADILATDRKKERLAHIAESYDIKIFSKNYEVVQKADIIILAVKPKDTKDILEDIKGELAKDKLLVSSIAGISVGYLKENLIYPLPIIRIMPNMSIQIKEGAIGLYADSNASGSNIKDVVDIFESMGRVVVVENEELLNGVTGLSGSGPAYFFLILEAFIDAGVSVGLTRENARILTLQTALGAIRLMMESSKHPSELKDMVTSPGGTTIAGLSKLEEEGVRSAIIKAVNAATEKARNLTE